MKKKYSMVKLSYNNKNEQKLKEMKKKTNTQVFIIRM